MSLTLSDISYTYGADTSYAQQALTRIGLEVAPGELVIVAGATGSGKSTLLRIAAGLLGGFLGSASIDGEPLTAATARGSVGLVFQDAESQLFADTLLDDVMFGPRNLGRASDEARDDAIRALEAVGLPLDTFGARSPFTLSGGEARRAAIAGVVAMGPRYLLADEPTAGLDARGRALVRDIVLDARRQAGVVVVSHTVEEFLDHADRVLLLDGGACSWSGPAAALVHDPSPLARAGLVAPDVLTVQVLAAAHGCGTGSFALDPHVAAARLAAGRGR